MRFLKCSKRSHPPCALLDVLAVVQSQSVAQFLAIIAECQNLAIRLDSQTIGEGNLTRIWDTQDVALRKVAGRASVKQVGVLAPTCWIYGNRDEMFNAEDSRPDIPLFSMQAIDTSKRELVTQPIPIAFVIPVALWAVAPSMSLRRVFESEHR
jgi:hypothetical protein